ERILGAVPSDDKTFFSGAHLGMKIQDCLAYYRKLENVAVHRDSDAPPGEAKVEFRTTAVPNRTVQIYYRRDQHNKVVSVSYGKRGAGEILSETEQKYLLSLNRGHDVKITAQGWLYEVATPKQYKTELDETWLDPGEIGKHLFTTIPQLGECGK